MRDWMSRTERNGKIDEKVKKDSRWRSNSWSKLKLIYYFDKFWLRTFQNC